MSQASPILQQALERLDTSEEEIYLDFAPVRRIQASELERLAELVSRAEARQRRVTLGSVNVNVYLVLKLVKLAPRMEFRT